MNVKEHLLACLAEEAAEVVQCATKSLRFGLDDRNVLNPTGPTNRERLISELNDMRAVIKMLEAEGVLPMSWEHDHAMHNKVAKVLRFIKYAKEHGALKDDALGEGRLG